MYQSDAEVIFPPRVIKTLRLLRGPDWQHLIEHVMVQPEENPDVLAFSLLMIRLTGCLSCHAHSYRAMRGCTMCASHTIARYKGTDQDLIDAWEVARHEILHWQETGTPPTVD